jgi:hypothetical protein
VPRTKDPTENSEVSSIARALRSVAQRHGVSESALAGQSELLAYLAPDLQPDQRLGAAIQRLTSQIGRISDLISQRYIRAGLNIPCHVRITENSSVEDRLFADDAHNFRSRGSISSRIEVVRNILIETALESEARTVERVIEIFRSDLLLDLAYLIVETPKAWSDTGLEPSASSSEVSPLEAGPTAEIIVDTRKWRVQIHGDLPDWHSALLRSTLGPYPPPVTRVVSKGDSDRDIAHAEMTSMFAFGLSLEDVLQDAIACLLEAQAVAYPTARSLARALTGFFGGWEEPLGRLRRSTQYTAFWNGRPAFEFLMTPSDFMDFSAPWVTEDDRSWPPTEGDLLFLPDRLLDARCIPVIARVWLHQRHERTAGLKDIPLVSFMDSRNWTYRIGSTAGSYEPNIFGSLLDSFDT